MPCSLRAYFLCKAAASLSLLPPPLLALFTYLPYLCKPSSLMVYGSVVESNTDLRSGSGRAACFALKVRPARSTEIYFPVENVEFLDKDRLNC